jgi:protein-L-isoaspartate O-methyltransferase
MTTAIPTTSERKATRLESSARTLLSKAESAIAQQRTTNTRKRAHQAASAIESAQRHALRAKVALAVVDAGGKLGPATISSLKDIEVLELELSRATGWLDADRRTNDGDAEAAAAAEPAKFSGNVAPWALEEFNKRANAISKMGLHGIHALRNALSALVALRSSVDRPTEDPVRALERRLVGFTAPGFFPTPVSIARRMAELAEIGPGVLVLEPSAGSGRLADAARERGGAVECIEINHTLVELLRAKGHATTQQDFLQTLTFEVYGACVMNPPFEDGLDALHVRHAFEKLKPGGVLVAITSEGIWFRQDRVAREFREWIETVELFTTRSSRRGRSTIATSRSGPASRAD